MLREVGAMDQLDLFIDRIPMNGQSQSVGARGEGTGA
jgi:hypothetical protein